MENKPKKIRVNFPGITSEAWEHPADKAALLALRKVPGIDKVIKALYSVFDEKSIYLYLLATSVRVNEKQFGRVHRIYMEACTIFDIPEDERPALFVTQTPFLNAGAIGWSKPMITLNSGVVEQMSDDELMAIIGHELGHILSGHVLYRTLLFLLLKVTDRALPMLTGIALKPIILALQEWNRKSELSCDRAGLLAVQDPEVVINMEMKMAGGRNIHEMDLGEFIKQAEEYESSDSISDSFHKLMNVLSYATTHPFAVTRLNELLKWVQGGEYDQILRGFYKDLANERIAETTKKAGKGYADDFFKFTDSILKGAKDATSFAKEKTEEAFSKKVESDVEQEEEEATEARSSVKAEDIYDFVDEKAQGFKDLVDDFLSKK
ncbi:M48 family metallopeptidase [Sediminitomix flava]|uniref:Zn-dependent protease with chaperone function n=1 Tax=Sediminitomix flava TaxID=379075 RepID=A0A315ZF68_SEDFL|nr:M48 family metallopeptidase [Sediminitomix flava]PWJ43384.1 Zn-dependent protease with chaperone function [Sediminitomix flava]